MSFTKIRFEVRHDYGEYTHSEAIDWFDTYEEAKALYDECVAAEPDEWDDAFELNKLTEEFDSEEESEDGSLPNEGEMETLESHVINEYVDPKWG